MDAKHRAWASTEIEQAGIGRVLIARRREPGWWEVGAFVLDVWCLGVKEASVFECEADEFDDMICEEFPEGDGGEIEPACARALVEGAVAYAQSLGFLPHRDFRKARKVFGSLKATDCTRTFTFGREGRPCFVAGPDDDEARISRVLAVLTARCGRDGFDYEDALAADAGDGEEDLEAAIDTLYLFIESGRCPDPAFTTAEVHGFITGLLILPDEGGPATWLPAVWRGLQPAFRDEVERAAIDDGLLALYHQTDYDFEENRPVVALPEAGTADREAAARRFCAGLLRGLGLDRGVLAWMRGHPEAGSELGFVGRIAAGEDPVGNDFEDRIDHALKRLYDIAGELPPRARPPAG